jgi:hypothetical protein
MVSEKIKYPRTYHHPLSEGFTDDDKIHPDISFFENKEVVITLKMDGENTNFYHDYFHARSLDSKHHPSRDWVKNYHSQIKHNIPENFRICGENLFAKHSIDYQDLKSFFYSFSVWDNKICLDWNTTLEWFELLNIVSVETIYRGIYSEKTIQQLIKNFDTINNEGFVIRTVDSFHYDNFKLNVAKYVRKNHVQTNEHWSKNWTQNNLKDDKC